MRTMGAASGKKPSMLKAGQGLESAAVSQRFSRLLIGFPVFLRPGTLPKSPNGSSSAPTSQPSIYCIYEIRCNSEFWDCYYRRSPSPPSQLQRANYGGCNLAVSEAWNMRSGSMLLMLLQLCGAHWRHLPLTPGLQSRAPNSLCRLGLRLRSRCCRFATCARVDCDV